ncbi:MAG: helix-turn-helix domain-containing protein [Acidimicrobiales bacterium]
MRLTNPRGGQRPDIATPLRRGDRARLPRRRRRVRLQRSTVELEAGLSVTATAHACGFSSVSAFVTAFRTEVSAPPGEWARSARQ